MTDWKGARSATNASAASEQDNSHRCEWPGRAPGPGRAGSEGTLQGSWLAEIADERHIYLAGAVVLRRPDGDDLAVGLDDECSG